MEFMMKKLSITTKILGVVLCVGGVSSHMLGMWSTYEWYRKGAESKRCEEEAMLVCLETTRNHLVDGRDKSKFALLTQIEKNKINLLDKNEMRNQYKACERMIAPYNFYGPVGCVCGVVVGFATYIGLMAWAQPNPDQRTIAVTAIGAGALTTSAFLGYRQYKIQPFTQFQKGMIGYAKAQKIISDKRELL
jgi:hypothetical protein